MKKFLIYYFAGNVKMYVSINLFKKGGCVFTSDFKKAKIFNSLEVADAICSQFFYFYEGLDFEIEVASYIPELPIYDLVAELLLYVQKDEHFLINGFRTAEILKQLKTIIDGR